jgi:hypothetical protein
MCLLAIVARVSMLLPQEQVNFTFAYLGWIFSFMVAFLGKHTLQLQKIPHCRINGQGGAAGKDFLPGHEEIHVIL